MLVYPNQRIFTVHRTSVKKYFTALGNDYAIDMIRNLSPSEFTVLYYLLMKIPSTEYALTPKDIAKDVRLAYTTIRDTIIPSLIEKGYIKNISGNRYVVTDNPNIDISELIP